MASNFSTNRRELSKFVPDKRTLRQFENLSSAITIDIDDSTVEANTAISKANMALYLSEKSLRMAKSSRALLWLSM